MKHTSGGKYEHDEEYIYFLASNPERYEVASERLAPEPLYQYPYVLFAVNELESQIDFERADRQFDQGRKVLIDSGVFNLAMGHARRHDMTMDVALSLPPEEVDGFEELLDRYYHVADRYKDRMWGMIEIDQGGAAVKPHTRARIERESGITPIPVWHPLLDGIDYYHQLVAEYDRMCVGNLVKADPGLRIRMLSAVSELSRENPNTWHHLLGVTPSELTYALPIKGSSDSSTWLSGCRWPIKWGSRSMGKKIAEFGPEYWYESSSYYRVDGVSLNECAAEMEHVREVQKEFASW